MPAAGLALPAACGCNGALNGGCGWIRQLRRKLAATILRSNVRFMHDRVCFAVGGNAHPGDAFSRRRAARSRFFEDGDPYSAAWAQRQMRFQRAPPPAWTTSARG